MTEDHPFNYENFYGATKVAGEALARGMFKLGGVPYVALRYMNVYGPRQDYSGAYIAVIMRMLDAIDRDEPLTIYGDGSQAYDFVYVGDCAQANVCAMQADTVDRAYNVGTGTRTSIAELAELRPAHHRLRRRRPASPRRRHVRARTASAPPSGAMTRSASRLASSFEDGPARADRVAAAAPGRAAAAPGARADPVSTYRNIPIAAPVLGDEEWQALREPLESGWLTQGPQVAAFEAAFAERHGVEHALADTSCTTALHLCLAALGHRPRRRGDRARLHVGRDRQRGRLLRRHAGLRRRRPAHVQPRRRRRAPQGHRAHASGHRRPPLRAVRRRRRAAGRAAAGGRARRGRRLRRRRRPPGPPGRWTRRHRGVLVPPAQVDHHRRGRHGHDRRRAARGDRRPPPQPRRRDLRGAAPRRRRAVPAAGVRRHRLQLPHERPAGGRRASSSCASSTRSSTSATRSPIATRTRSPTCPGSRCPSGRPTAATAGSRT